MSNRILYLTEPLLTFLFDALLCLITFFIASSHLNLIHAILFFCPMIFTVIRPLAAHFIFYTLVNCFYDSPHFISYNAVLPSFFPLYYSTSYSIIHDYSTSHLIHCALHCIALLFNSNLSPFFIFSYYLFSFLVISFHHLFSTSLFFFYLLFPFLFVS